MITSFRDAWLQAFFVEDVRSRAIPADLESRLFRKLQMLDDATTDQDLRVPASNHFEKLQGALAGLHSIRVNKQWRLIFRWDGARGAPGGDRADFCGLFFLPWPVADASGSGLHARGAMPGISP